jgi:hypothetical protein
MDGRHLRWPARDEMRWINTPARAVNAFLTGRWPQPFYHFGTWTLVVVSGLAAGGIARQLIGLG